jgi:hypothetical protein
MRSDCDGRARIGRMSKALPGRLGASGASARAKRCSGVNGKSALQLRGVLGINFAQYKLSTVMRRIRRRVSLRQLQGFEAYVELLRTDERELAASMQGRATR